MLDSAGRSPGSHLSLCLNDERLGLADLHAGLRSLSGAARQFWVPGQVWGPCRMLRVDAAQGLPLDGARLEPTAKAQLQHSVPLLHLALRMLSRPQLKSAMLTYSMRLPPST